MKRTAAAKFNEQCLAILDRLGTEPAALIGSLKGRLTIKAGIRTTGAKWDAERGSLEHPRHRARKRASKLVPLA